MDARPRLSRRALLAGSGAGLALPWVLRGARAAPAPAIAEAAWRQLAGQISGGVLQPNDPRFVMLTRPENLRYYNPPAMPGGAADPDAPFAVVRPRDARQVAAAILWAEHNACPMVPRSGGHSYAGCSTIRGLVIHGGAMRQVRLDRASGLVEIGGGAVNGDIFTALQNSGRAIVHGRCKAVGISAYLMGGGIGLAMREHGVGCDLVESVELVLADGRTVRASANNAYKELFWAVRGGGGGNLGYATRWWLHTVPAEPVVAFSAIWRASGNPSQIVKRLVRALEAAPAQVGAQMSIAATAAGHPGPGEITLIGQFRGPRGRFQALLGAALADASQQDVVLLPYWQAQEFFEIEAEPNRYQETSLFAASLSDALIDEALSQLRTLPGPDTSARLTLFLTGGRINQVRPGATAFVHRSSQWLLNIILGWQDNDRAGDALAWQRKLQDTCGRILGERSCYQNFPDPGLGDPAEAYWGADLARLGKLKAAVDPHRVFTPPRHQEIPQPR